MKRRSVVLLAIALLSATSFTALSTSAAYANTSCDPDFAHNAGVASDGGSTYWGWCHPNGGSVRYRLSVLCPNGGGGTTSWASGSGDGTIYTNSETCWFGQSATATGLENG